MVSTRVVNTSISVCNWGSRNFTDAPTDFPIQLRCISTKGSGQSTVSNPRSKRSAYAVIRIDHCIIFFCSTGYPPRSDTPLITSSFANTVPKAAHQFTVLSRKYASLYFNNSRCCSSSEKPFHSVAVNVNISSSQTASISSEPESLNRAIKLSIDSALSVSLLYQALNNCMKIHCVHL